MEINVATKGFGITTIPMLDPAGNPHTMTRIMFEDTTGIVTVVTLGQDDFANFQKMVANPDAAQAAAEARARIVMPQTAMVPPMKQRKH
jgi:hypothetical protein